MSLINQVLRDLEDRKRREHPAPGEISAVNAHARNLPRTFFVLAGIVLLAVTGYILWINLHKVTPPAIVKAVVPVTAALKPSQSVPATPVVAVPTMQPASSPAKPVATRPSPAAAVIATHISLLNAATLDDNSGFRLQFDHAPDYRLFTLHDPERIVLDVSKVAVASDFTAHTHLPGGVTDTRFSLEPGNRMRVVFEVAQGVTANATAGNDATLVLHFNDSAGTSASAPGIRTATASVAAVSADASGMLKTPRNRPQDLAQNAYSDGLAQLNAGDSLAAERRFREALRQLPSFDPARVALARLLSQAGRDDAAATVLTEGIKLGKDKPQFARLDAELLVQRGAVADALRVLQSALPDIRTTPEHYAFMAALAQRSGDNARAAKLYREILAIRPDNGVWWMGLGISLERIKQPQAALDAYRHAQQAGDLSPDVIQFVNQRIKALEP
ncbi:MAG TPA: tetratricopeptide repeat protein [Gammaproteobacteria bacterium]